MGNRLSPEIMPCSSVNRLHWNEAWCCLLAAVSGSRLVVERLMTEIRTATPNTYVAIETFCFYSERFVPINLHWAISPCCRCRVVGETIFPRTLYSAHRRAAPRHRKPRARPERGMEWTARNVDFPFPWWTTSCHVILWGASYQEPGCLLGELNRKGRARVENTVSTAEASQQFPVYSTSWIFSQVGRYRLWLHRREQTSSRRQLLEQLQAQSDRRKLYR